MNLEPGTLAILNTLLNAGSILGWVAFFYLMLSRGSIVTRRENTLTLALKDQVIATKDQTIAEQRKQLDEYAQIWPYVRELVIAGKRKVDQQKEVDS